MKPENYITVSWEHRNGYAYLQPIERLNGKTYFDYPKESFERQNWGRLSWESKKYNDALDYCRYNSELWSNEKSKNEALQTIYNFLKQGKSGTGSSVTPLFNFEIYLINDGFKMLSFSECNAINPSLVPICAKVSNNEITGLKGFIFTRSYAKGKNTISIAFGHGGTHFYFVSRFGTFQIDNEIVNYKKAISGKLKSIAENESKITVDLNQYFNLDGKLIKLTKTD